MTVTLTDGGTGTELAARGYAGSSLDAWRDAADVLEAIHRDFVHAGAEIVVASTFLASSSQGSLEAVRGSIAIARASVTRQTRIAASLGPGTIDRALVEACAGADLLFLETMTSVEGADRLFGIAREAFAGPIFVSFAVDGMATYGGDSLFAIADWVRDARPDAAGFNCGTGTASVLDALSKVGDRFAGSLIARPAASAPGLPVESPHAFAAFAREAIRLGASVVGGCCGAGTAHIAAIATEVAKVRGIG